MDRSLEPASGVTELPRAALHLACLLDADGAGAGLRVQRDLGLLARADEVHRAAGEHEVVATNVVGVAGPVGDLDDLADAVKDALEGDHAADDRPASRLRR